LREGVFVAKLLSAQSYDQPTDRQSAAAFVPLQITALVGGGF
jgi:hypothetical protein